MAWCAARLRTSDGRAFALPSSGARFQNPAHGGDEELSLGDRTRQCSAESIIAMAFEQRVERLDFAVGTSLVSMSDLRQKRERVGTEIEQRLAFGVELGAVAVHRGDLRGPVLRQ